MQKIFSFISILICSSALAQDSLNVRHLFNWDDPAIPNSIIGNPYNDIWGYAANGREYAFLGSTAGVHIFDVTDPEATQMIDMVPGRVTGEGIIHRDYKVYADHLFAVCDEGASSLQIMDLQSYVESIGGRSRHRDYKAKQKLMARNRVLRQ